MTIQSHDHSDTGPIAPEIMAPSDPAERERLLFEAEAEIEAGQGIPHDEVAAWLRALAAGRPAKAPCGP